jgi:gliding motility-associated-like protein
MRFIFIILSLLPFFLSGQNLIPNGSFEQYDTCPDNTAQIARALPWFSAQGSCDYFNICSSSIYVTPPNNTYGFQYPHIGNGFAGFAPLAYYQFTNIPTVCCRECLSVKLTEPLKPNTKYCLEFYTVMGDVSGAIIKNIGVYFSQNSIIQNNGTYIHVTPQIETTQTFLSDSINWVKVIGEYTALGGEEYILIGNFRDTISAEIQVIDPLFGSAYYFFDDFSLIECDSIIPTLPFLIPNTFTPDGNGFNDFFTIQSIPPNTQLTIYNRWGTVVYQSNNYQNNWDGGTCTDGVYYYIVNTATGKQYKGTLTILR